MRVTLINKIKYYVVHFSWYCQFWGNKVLLWKLNSKWSKRFTNYPASMGDIWYRKVFCKNILVFVYHT